MKPQKEVLARALFLGSTVRVYQENLLQSRSKKNSSFLHLSNCF